MPDYVHQRAARALIRPRYPDAAMTLPSHVLETSLVTTLDPPLGSGPIIVATDGSAECDAAVNATWMLAGRTCADVEVVSVLSLMPLVPELAVLAPPPQEFWEEQWAAQRLAVRLQLERLLPATCDWKSTELSSEPGAAIAAHAHAQHARLLVMGRGRHSLSERIVADETVLRVLRLSDVPVFATDPRLVELPRRIVIATDFSAYSTYAARLALSIAAPGAMIYIAHVRPKPRFGGRATDRWQRSYAVALPEMFTSFRARLDVSPEMQVEPIVLEGLPGKSLVDFAEASAADLIVSATHGYGFMNRLMLGSVATDLLRHAPCSLLCVPGSAVSHVTESQ
jgi:nucleotide-binding universal stress UspA family protein